jgi:ferrochelatase
MSAAVLLLAHGSPDRVEEVPEFLRNVTGGRPMPEAVVKEVQHRYSLIGRSPLRDITLRQAELLAAQVALPVYVGMRNWTPFIRDTIARMSAAGVTRAIALCLAPQNSRTSVGLYRKAVEAAAPPFALDFVDDWHDHPLLARAFAERLEPAWKRACAEAGARLPIVFTAHSVPSRSIEAGDPYAEQARYTAEMVAMLVGSLPSDGWRFAFQSQGMSGGEWLGPTVEATIEALARDGHRGLFVQPIGFVCDHVEVLFDIDIMFRDFAAARGMKLWRAPSLNDSPTFIAALADIVRSRLAAQPNPSSGLVQIQ